MNTTINHTNLHVRNIILAIAGSFFLQFAAQAQTNIFEANGNVGIGTTNPINKLHVVGPILSEGPNAYLGIRGNGYLTFQFYNQGASLDQKISEIIDSNGIIVFRTVNDPYSTACDWLQVYRKANSHEVEKVLIAPDAANVGIGVLDPKKRLSVAGGIDAQGPVGYFLDEQRLALWEGTKVVADPTADGGKAICRQATQPEGNVWFGPYTMLPPGNYLVQFRMKVANNGSNADLVWLDVTESIDCNILAQKTIKASDFRKPNEWQTFTLPINVTANMTTLQMRGLMCPSGVTDVYLDYINVVAGDMRGYYSDEFSITPKGNVGIGTAAPDAKLTIQGDSSGSVILSVGGSSDGRLRTRHIGGKRSDGAGEENLFIQNGTAWNTFINTEGGNVGIGTYNLTHKLTVNGTIRAREVIVDDTGWADYVFEAGYALPSLETVEQHIKTQKHLPGIPSAREVAAKGVSLGDMQTLLLAKIEELTLHQIELNKRVKALEEENAALKTGQK